MIRLSGGPFDGATLSLGDGPLPDEVIVRTCQAQPYGDAVYRFGNAPTLSQATFSGPTYRYVGASEIMQLVHGQARQIVCRDDEIQHLKKRLEVNGRRLGRHLAAMKAAKTRKKKTRP